MQIGSTLKYLGVVLASLIFAGLLIGQSLAEANCFCRHKDGHVIEGQTTCIKTNSGMKLARCEKVLNNTSWKLLNQPCPVS